MPELPEVETTMRGLRARLVGRRITELVQRRADIRFPLPRDLRERLVGQRVTGFSRRAKYILWQIEPGQAMLLHLGMSGRLLLDGEPRGVHEHVTLHFDDGATLRFVDPRRFGMLDLASWSGIEAHRWLAHLGHEPLDPGFDGPALLAALRGRRTALKVALMDQRLVVGVGNIYASESLHRAGLSPLRQAGSLSAEEAHRLVAQVRAVLEEAILAGGSSLRDYVQSDGELGNFQRAFRVYDRHGQACAACGAEITRVVQGGRATYFCRSCQA